MKKLILSNDESKTKHIRKVLRDQLQIPIKDITDFAATIDGSDVLFTGQEFFVG